MNYQDKNYKMKLLLFFLSTLLMSLCVHAQNNTPKKTSKPNTANYQVNKPVVRQGTIKETNYYDLRKTMLEESYFCMSDGRKQGNYFHYFMSGKLMEESVYYNGELRYSKTLDEFGNVLNVGTYGYNCKMIYYNYKDKTEPAEKKLFVACLLYAIDTYLINVEIYNEEGIPTEKFNSNIKISDILDSKGNIKKESFVNYSDLPVNGLLIRINDTIKIKALERMYTIVLTSPTNVALYGSSKSFMSGSLNSGYCFGFRFE